MAHTNLWDAPFEAKPANADEAKEGAVKIRDLKLDARERMALQHFLVPGTDNDMHGAHKFIPLDKTATHTCDPTTGLESFTRFSGLAANVELDLPAVSGLDGLMLFVSNEDGTYDVDIDPNGAETVNGGAAGVVYNIKPGGRIILICDEGNTNWVVFADSLEHRATNWPSFSVYLSAQQNNITGTDQIEFDTEEFDTNSDFNTTTFEFIPTVAGKYLLSVTVLWATVVAADTLLLYIYKNGVQHKFDQKLTGGGDDSQIITTIVDANGVDDDFKIYAQNVTRDTSDIRNSTSVTHWTGCRIG